MQLKENIGKKVSIGKKKSALSVDFFCFTDKPLIGWILLHEYSDWFTGELWILRAGANLSWY